MDTANRPLHGIMWMVATGLCFIAVTATVKHGAQDLPAAQAAFLRYLLGLVFILPVARSLLAARMPWRDVGLFGLRGLVHALAVILWFYAMTQIPIAEVTAMNYLNPVYVTIGAALLLGERLALRRILAVVAALVGVIIILRPGFREIETGHLAMLFTAMLFGASYLTAKPLAGRHSAAMVVAMLSVTVTIGLAPFAWAVWVPPTWGDVGWMFVVALFATGGHYAMTRAFAAAPVSVTQPVAFLQMVWAVLLGWAVFDEPPDIYVILGAAIIIAAVSFIAWREARLRRQVTPHAVATKT
ncbi:peptide ABC transporter permease [Jannaschia pagri]|uniref:Peptide ABC transporter permease n=1 Tax=Jannaschia pagri TaxID=2829797 RepID=A0ABQ4NIZ5_9RHOB|nr:MULTISPECIES: DMT family transporter [unclassified Jannaschia]GIT90550.1 peptide ABC transporter permease [Jannaschia sp. AI_61]GIT94382.1 peptide ABC transporter permease [Jannaschia sp. AI_62]